MLNSKRSRLAAVALSGACALALASCGGETTPSKESPDPSGPATSTEGAAAASYTSRDCAADATSENILKVGTILPITGTLAFMGPPTMSGVGLAVDDIAKAGFDACTYFTDSGDSNDMTVSTASAADLIKAKVSVAVGAASSSVTLNVVDQLAAAPIVMFSPANTAATLSGYSDFYFRTAPPDTVQGAALGAQIVSDGAANVAFLVFNDAYGTGLRDVVQKTVEDAGATVTYGGTGKGQEFPPGQTTFSSEVTAALATKPDAIVVIAFDETVPLVGELVSQGWDMTTTYYTDGNTSDYSAKMEPGTLEGAQGTIPGANAADDFKALLKAWHESVQGKPLNDFSYAAESYDATVLTALAAVKGGATDPTTIQANLAAVSGASSGDECTIFADCKALLDSGKEIHYKGVAGTGPFNKNNDPSSAFVGIYKFDANNKPVWTQAVEGEA